MNQKGAIHFYLVILIIVLIFAGCIYVLLPEKTSVPLNSEFNKTTQKTFQKNDLVGRQLLVSEIPNFEALEGDNLPNFNDIRSVMPYGENLIVMGVNRVVEYDPKTESILRINSKILSSIVSAAIIGDNLYLAANAPNNDELPFPGKTQIYIVDLKSGIITGTFLDKDNKSYANLDVVAKDGFLWISSWDGIYKLDPLGGKMTLINILEYGGNGYHLFLENDKIVLYQSDSRHFLDEANLNLVKDKSYNQSIASKINKNAKDFGLDIPNYFAASDLINDKYYLFAPTKISTLKKGQMPELFMNIKLRDEYFYSVSRAKVSEDENYALIILPIGGPWQAHASLKHILYANLINLKTGEVTDLLNSPLGNGDSEVYFKMLGEMDNYITYEIPEGFSIRNNNEVEIMNISTKTKQLKINNPYPNPSN